MTIKIKLITITHCYSKSITAPGIILVINFPRPAYTQLIRLPNVYMVYGIGFDPGNANFYPGSDIITQHRVLWTRATGKSIPTVYTVN